MIFYLTPLDYLINISFKIMVNVRKTRKKNS